MCVRGTRFCFIVESRQKPVKNSQCHKCRKFFVRSGVNSVLDKQSSKLHYICHFCDGVNQHRIVAKRLCTVCHEEKGTKTVIRFEFKNYDISNTLTREALNFRKQDGPLEYICRKCDFGLNKSRNKRNASARINPCFQCRAGMQCKVSAEPDWLNIAGKINQHGNYKELEQYIKSLPPFPVLPTFCGNEHKSHYRKDLTAACDLPSDCPIQSALPVETSGENNNCFPNTLSRLVFGNEEHATEMRVRLVRCAIEHKDMFLNESVLKRGYDCPHIQRNLCDIYVEYGKDGYSAPQHLTPAEREYFYKKDVVDFRRSGCRCGIWQLHQAAEVLQCPVNCIYPHLPTNFDSVRTDFNRTFLPLQPQKCHNETVYIMFCRSSGSLSQVNHFVPVVPASPNIVVTSVNRPTKTLQDFAQVIDSIDLTSDDLPTIESGGKTSRKMTYAQAVLQQPCAAPTKMLTQPSVASLTTSQHPSLTGEKRKGALATTTTNKRPKNIVENPTPQSPTPSLRLPSITPPGTKMQGIFFCFSITCERVPCD